MSSNQLERQKKVFEAARQYGTPAYVYDIDQLAFNVQLFDELRSCDYFQLNYACKANSNINILDYMRREGLGLDLVSPGEIDLAIHLGFKPQLLFFTPSNASNDELAYALEKGVQVVADHIDAVRFIGENYPERAFGLRIKPDITDGGNEKVKVGGRDSKFGISLQDIAEYAPQWQDNGYKIDLLHAHVGSDLEGLDSFKGILDLFLKVKPQFPGLKKVNIGGGYAVNYDSDHPKWSIEELHEIIHDFNEKTGLSVMTEPGKFLVSNIGYFVSRVNRKKPGTNFEFLCLDSGFNHFIRPMYYNASHRVITEKDNRPKTHNYRLVGNICEKDEFNQHITLPEMEAGDFLAFINSGAYCYSMASNYNLRFLPREILLLGDQIAEVTRAATLQELVNRQKLVQVPSQSKA